MTKLPITYRGTVYPWHCDHMGHMNVMWYTGKFDEASWHFLAQIGLTRSVLRERNRLMAAVQQNITYKQELYAGDIITIRSGILEVKEKVMEIFHEMKNEETGKVSAIAVVTGIHMNATTRKSCPFPEDTLERGQELLVNYAEWSLGETQPVPNHSPRYFFPGESDYRFTK